MCVCLLKKTERDEEIDAVCVMTKSDTTSVCIAEIRGRIAEITAISPPVSQSGGQIANVSFSTHSIYSLMSLYSFYLIYNPSSASNIIENLRNIKYINIGMENHT